jgi:hypothetical protein
MAFIAVYVVLFLGITGNFIQTWSIHSENNAPREFSWEMLTT